MIIIGADNTSELNAACIQSLTSPYKASLTVQCPSCKRRKRFFPCPSVYSCNAKSTSAHGRQKDAPTTLLNTFQQLFEQNAAVRLCLLFPAV